MRKKSAANILYKKQGASEPEEIIQYLIKKDIKLKILGKQYQKWKKGKYANNFNTRNKKIFYKD